MMLFKGNLHRVHQITRGAIGTFLCSARCSAEDVRIVLVHICKTTAGASLHYYAAAAADHEARLL